MSEFENKIYGSILGLAIGDAFGAPVEFKARGSYPKVTEYQAGGEFNLPKGYWTDDTSLALCILDSINRTHTFDLKSQMLNFRKWWHDGFMSSTGFCFDIGNTTKKALARFEKENVVLAGLETDPATNGAIMRLAPVSFYFHHSFNDAIKYSMLHTATTHGALESKEASAVLTYVLLMTLQGKSKNEILKFTHFEYLLQSRIKEIQLGSFKNKSENEISGKGLAYDTLEAALYSFYHSENFIDGLIIAVNLGDDTDTVGAVYGQIAGAYYGLKAIPTELVLNLHEMNKIMTMTKEYLEIIK